MSLDLSFEFVNLSQLIKKLSQLLSKKCGTFKISVMKNGEPVAVVLSIAEYRALEEAASQQSSLSLLVDDKDYEQIRRGEVDEYETVAE